MNTLARIVFCMTVLAAAAASANESTWSAGAAKVAITPEHLMWMSGYGGRDHPAEGKLQDLWAKALVLQDSEGRRGVLITLDLVGIDRASSRRICQRLEEEFALERSAAAINCSHTHCGPAVGRNLAAMYFLDDAQWNRIDEYTAWMEDQVVAAVDRAIEALEPAHLSHATGKATFAVNRRNNDRNQIIELRRTHQLKGPSDHSVPVLAVRAADDHQLLAVAAGYACHATTLQFYQWSGDYPGFYQEMIEANHPGTVALFWAGCGADQNPLPRSTVELAQEYGHRLGEAVETVLASDMRPLEGKLTTIYREIPLALEAVPSQEQLQQQTASSNKFEARRAQLLLEQIAAGQPLASEYPYPVQTWRLGELAWHFLGGEVVVDYALRLKQHDAARTWVAGYSNDVMAYIPSRRVWDEGGYEGAAAMVYYGLPSRWAGDVEERVAAEVAAQAQAIGPRDNRPLAD